ncbi:hypothetical protein D1872_247190 [compost metagenome]
MSDIPRVNDDLPALRGVKAKDKLDQGAFSAAGRAYKGKLAPTGQMETHSVQNLAVPIGKMYVFEPDIGDWTDRPSISPILGGQLVILGDPVEDRNDSLIFNIAVD